MIEGRDGEWERERMGRSFQSNTKEMEMNKCVSVCERDTIDEVVEKNEHHLRFFSLSLSLLPLCITSSIHNVWCAFCVFQCVTFKSVVEVAAVISISCIESICSVCRLVVGFLFAFFYCIDNCKCVNMCVCRFSIIVFCHQLFLFSSMPRALLLSRFPPAPFISCSRALSHSPVSFSHYRAFVCCVWWCRMIEFVCMFLRILYLSVSVVIVKIIQKNHIPHIQQ